MDQDIAAGLVFGDLGEPAGLAVPQGDDRGDLDGLEDPVIVIALDRLEGTSMSRLPAAKPTRHPAML